MQAYRQRIASQGIQGARVGVCEHLFQEGRHTSLVLFLNKQVDLVPDKEMLLGPERRWHPRICDLQFLTLAWKVVLVSQTQSFSLVSCGTPGSSH